MSNGENEIIGKDIQSVLLKDVIPIEYAKKAVEAYMKTIYVENRK